MFHFAVTQPVPVMEFEGIWLGGQNICAAARVVAASQGVRSSLEQPERPERTALQGA